MGGARGDGRVFLPPLAFLNELHTLILLYYALHFTRYVRLKDGDADNSGFGEDGIAGSAAGAEGEEKVHEWT